MISFLRPLMLGLLVFIPVDIFLQMFWKKRGNAIRFPIRMWPTGTLSPRRPGLLTIYFLSLGLYWASLGSFILASAGPVRVVRQEIYTQRTGDIIFVLDESPSMAARDLVPENRFEAAKQLITEFIKENQNNHIGLVTFGSDAVLQLPPTTDYNAVLERIDSLELGDLGSSTAIGSGLGVAVAQLSESLAPTRSVVLLTDGVNNAGKISPTLAAKAASASGIRVFSVVLGNPGESGLEYRDPETGETYSGIAIDTVDTGLLREIADTTGGSYLPAPNSMLLGRVLQVIGSSNTVTSTYRFDAQPFHRPVILFGLIFLSLHVFIRRLILREIFP